MVARSIQDFVINKLSNWYIRLSRRRFWKGNYNNDKIAAYQTLYECLKNIAIISSPISPFYMDQLFQDLTSSNFSVHLCDFPKFTLSVIDDNLERRMALAQNITSLALSLRKKEGLRVRQPLEKIMISILDKKTKKDIERGSSILKNELNIKNIEFIPETSNFLKKKIKPNFKTLGPKFGKNMKLISRKIQKFKDDDIKKLEKNNSYHINESIIITLSDVEIISADIPGFSVTTNNGITVALDVTLSKELEEEGLAREFVNRIQKFRKDFGFEVTDKIKIYVEKNDLTRSAIKNNLTYICEETLATELKYEEDIIKNATKINLINNISINVSLVKN